MESRPKFMSSSNKLKDYVLIKRNGRLVKVNKAVIAYNKRKSKSRRTRKASYNPSRMP